MIANTLDLLIIGAGPAGLSCGIAAQKAGLSYLIVDKGSIADSIQKFQREMYFFSTPELLEIGDIPFIVPTVRPTSLDCVNYYRGVTDHYKLNCAYYEEISSVRKGDVHFIVRSKGRSEYTARAVVVAAGYYDVPNPLGVPGEDLPHITRYYRDPLPYYQREVVIVGGKNSAVEAALDLWRHGAKVTVVHRGPTLSGNVKYWIVPDFENRVASGAIQFLRNSRVTRFLPGCTEIETEGAVRQIGCDAVFVLIGYRPDVPFLKSMGVAIDAESLAPAFNPETYETNVPGLYVAGGIVGGRFNNKVFIENGRLHGPAIVKHLLSKGKR